MNNYLKLFISLPVFILCCGITAAVVGLEEAIRELPYFIKGIHFGASLLWGGISLGCICYAIGIVFEIPWYSGEEE